MKIAICDDEKFSQDILKTYINIFCAKENISVQIDCFFCAEAFLRSEIIYAIVFMDIYLMGMNGIEAARQAKKSCNSKFVFTTTSQDYAVEAFGLNAAHYLIKPLTQDGVCEAMERCIAVIEKEPNKILQIKTNQTVFPIVMQNIIYVEVFNKISIIHTAEQNIQTYTSLDAILELLDEDFIKVQRSYIVNMNYIESFLGDKVLLRSGEEISISRNNRAELKNVYKQFLFTLARRNAM